MTRAEKEQKEQQLSAAERSLPAAERLAKRAERSIEQYENRLMDLEGDREMKTRAPEHWQRQKESVYLGLKRYREQVADYERLVDRITDIRRELADYIEPSPLVELFEKSTDKDRQRLMDHITESANA